MFGSTSRTLLSEIPAIISFSKSNIFDYSFSTPFDAFIEGPSGSQFCEFAPGITQVYEYASNTNVRLTYRPRKIVPIEGSLCSDLAALVAKYEEDLKLVSSDGNEFFINTHTFMARSEVFRTMMQIQMKEKRNGFVTFQEIDSNLMEPFVEFLKTDSVSDATGKEAKLAYLASQYNLPGLFMLVQSYFLENYADIRLEDLTLLATKFNSAELFKVCSKKLLEKKPA